MGQLSQNIFGKDIKSLTIKDIQDFFSTEQVETSVMEFKSGDVTLEKIFCIISAFLNTNGGVLIIGAPKKLPNRDIESYVGDLMPTMAIKSEQSLIHSISSNIVPSPVGIEIKGVKCGKGWVYVLEIPLSKYPPHQNDKDGKYYIRLDAETKRAPHGLIQALFFQRQYPNLEIELFVDNKKNISTFIDLVITNQSLVTADSIGIIVDFYGILYLSEIRNKPIQQGNVTFTPTEKVRKTDDRYHFFFTSDFGDLVKGLQIINTFEVGALNSNFLLSVAIWARNQELKTYTYVFDPNQLKAIYKNLDNKKENVFDLIEKYNVKVQPGLYSTADNEDEDED